MGQMKFKRAKSTGFLVVATDPDVPDGDLWREDCSTKEEVQATIVKMLQAGAAYIHVDSCEALRKFRNKQSAVRWAQTERGRSKIRHAGIRSRFNIDHEEYERLLSYPCAVCGGKSTDLDHDRACCPGYKSCGRCVRSGLCRKCNTGLGLLGDDPDRLRAGAIYLEHHRVHTDDLTRLAEHGAAGTPYSEETPAGSTSGA